MALLLFRSEAECLASEHTHRASQISQPQAGNRCLIKPSELTARTSELMRQLIGRYFDATELAVVTGGTELAQRFSSLPFDHLIFTGSTAVGRQVMAAAAEHLVPVTLELGGKGPGLVGRSADPVR